MAEPKTGLYFWPPGAMQPDLLFNAMLYWIAVWGQAVVIAIEDDPPGSPDEGDTYLIGTGSGEWAGHDDSLAYWSGQVWLYFPPLNGYMLRNLGTDEVLIYSSSWTVWSGGGSSRSTVTAVTSSSGVVTLDYSLGDYFTLALSENVTSWLISNPPGSGNGFTLMVQTTQDSTPRTVAKPGTTAGGAALDVSTGSGDIDLIAITSFNNGTTLRSSIAKDFS